MHNINFSLERVSESFNCITGKIQKKIQPLVHLSYELKQLAISVHKLGLISLVNKFLSLSRNSTKMFSSNFSFALKLSNSLAKTKLFSAFFIPTTMSNIVDYSKNCLVSDSYLRLSEPALKLFESVGAIGFQTVSVAEGLVENTIVDISFLAPWRFPVLFVSNLLIISAIASSCLSLYRSEKVENQLTSPNWNQKILTMNDKIIQTAFKIKPEKIKKLFQNDNLKQVMIDRVASIKISYILNIAARVISTVAVGVLFALPSLTLVAYGSLATSSAISIANCFMKYQSKNKFKNSVASITVRSSTAA